MTIPIRAYARAPERTASPSSARRAYRSRFWRLAIGGLGLFWVCVVLWLVGALIP